MKVYCSLITNNMMWRRWRRRRDMFCNVFLWTVVDIFFYNQPMVFRYRNKNNLDIVVYTIHQLLNQLLMTMMRYDDEIRWWIALHCKDKYDDDIVLTTTIMTYDNSLLMYYHQAKDIATFNNQPRVFYVYVIWIC